MKLKCARYAEYLGLCLNRNGFLGKEPSKVEDKARAELHMLVNEAWFELNLEPKHISREFLSRARSTMLYGAELLTTDARAPFVEIDDKLMSLFLSKMLKLGSAKLVKKHQLRIKLALGIPTLEMDI